MSSCDVEFLWFVCVGSCGLNEELTNVVRYWVVSHDNGHDIWAVPIIKFGGCVLEVNAQMFIDFPH